MNDDDLNKIGTPRGDARSMTDISQSMSSKFDQAGPDWFGPQAPMQPVAPPGVAGRAWDFQPGFNLNSRPRSYEQVDFPTLRALAEAYDPVRLIIERRKDQICRLPWSIRVKHDGIGKRPKQAHISAQTRGIVREVEQFFRFPSEGVSFRSWLRQLVEDVLVIDAPAVYCERDRAGGLVALSPIDGATIKLVIDGNGRRPKPRRWDGTPFDFLGQKVTTENYTVLGFKIADGLFWPVIAQQILKGLPAANLTALDLIYSPMNTRTNGVYGHSPVGNIVTTISTSMRRAASQFEYFREGNMPEGVFSLPETWTPDQVQRFQDHWDSMLSGNLANRRKMRFVPSGKNNAFQPFKEPVLKSEFDEWMIRIVCFAFSYPPAAFVALSNRSTAEQHERTAEEEGVEPLKAWAAEMIQGVIEREFDDTLEFAWLEEAEVDQRVEAEILERLVTNGIMTANEARERMGLEPSADAAANTLMTKTNNGFMPINAKKELNHADPE